MVVLKRKSSLPFVLSFIAIVLCFNSIVFEKSKSSTFQKNSLKTQDHLQTNTLSGQGRDSQHFGPIQPVIFSVKKEREFEESVTFNSSFETFYHHTWLHITIESQGPPTTNQHSV